MNSMTHTYGSFIIPLLNERILLHTTQTKISQNVTGLN